MPESRPALSARSIGRLHTALWLVCVLTYFGVFGTGYLSGASDFYSMGKAMGATVAIAFIGRMVLGLFESARISPQPPEEDENELGSLLDLVSSPATSADEPAPAPASAVRETVAAGAR